MNCPTCDHTMQALSTGERHSWCPRCGTIQQSDSHFVEVSVPKLVERCRELERATREVFDKAGHTARSEESGLLMILRRLGISDSIHPPEGKTTP